MCSRTTQSAERLAVGENLVAASLDLETATELLRQLALDLRCCWNHATDEIWRELDPDLWARTRNPWVVVQSVSSKRLGQTLAQPGFQAILSRHAAARQDAAQAAAWFQHAHPDSAISRVAYFSMEFMLAEALPIYAGGLGNVAGDQLKAANDLGVPVTGVGLLYAQGYFRQVIGADGAQQALFPYNDPSQLPITPVRGPDGESLRLELALRGFRLWLRAWQVKVGRLWLYLLDSNDILNHPAHRGITSELYGGGSELRLQQELVLGIGGWRLLEVLGLRPEVCHLNEGHAAFAILERARSFMQRAAQPFAPALAVTRAGNLFTTHTAVTAGFDRFVPQLIEHYLGSYATDDLHITLPELLALGRQNPDDDAEPLNMAYLALRGSGVVNAVSRLHGEVSRRIFLPLFPRWPQGEVPVGYVTNGVHTPSWDSAEADTLWTTACGRDRWTGTLESLEECVRRVSDSTLWESRAAARKSLVEYVRERLASQLMASGARAEEVDRAKHVFDPEALTLGFARRFATYKRPNLLLHDAERLVRLLSDAKRPVQLVLAGKAHPADRPGQTLIREWMYFVRRNDVCAHAIFLADDDMLLTEHLVQGVDVWINTPQRPWEACGTSGMKVLVNGGLNLSELDGWWAEAYGAGVGWALGDGKEHGGDARWDAIEATRLYELLERQVVPEFYSRDESSIPRAWVARVRESMATLTPRFSANRAVREYVERCYLPAAVRYRQRAADGGASGVQIVNWQRALERDWPSLRFEDVRVETRDDLHLFTVQVHLGMLDREVVRVELYAEPLNGGEAFQRQMLRSDDVSQSSGSQVYLASVPAARAASDYTARVIPTYPGVDVPLEVAAVLWQR
jgi:starch phosphorylase